MKPERDEAEIWRDPIIRDLDLLRARYVTQCFAPHAHDTFAIGVVETGALSFRYPILWEVVPAGQIWSYSLIQQESGESQWTEKTTR
jgi:hypothetical protein